MSSRPFRSSLPSRLCCGLSPHRLVYVDNKLDLRAGGTEVSGLLGAREAWWPVHGAKPAAVSMLAANVESRPASV